MFLLPAIAFTLGLESFASAFPFRRQDPGAFLYDGRAPLDFTAADLDQSKGPYLAVVKGNKSASSYFEFLGDSFAPTPLLQSVQPGEQAFRATIDNTSIFTPGTNPPQFGFRRSELIAQSEDGEDKATFTNKIQSGQTTFHFSVQADTNQPFNFKHEYQLVFIEPTDGTHVFDLQTGTPGGEALSDDDARMLRVRSKGGDVLFQTPFDENKWHNFGVAVDWDKLTLQVLFSQDASPLEAVTGIEENTGAVTGPDGQGEFHFGVLKLPLPDPADSPEDQKDVVNHGIQEGTTESLFYSGIFVENTQNAL